MRVYAYASFMLADLQQEDGEAPDLNLWLRAEQTWNELNRADPQSLPPRAWLVVVRLRIGDELDARGRREDAARYRRAAPSTGRGSADCFLEAALFFAENAELVGKYPTKLSAFLQEARRLGFSRHILPLLREAAIEGFRDQKRLLDEPRLGKVRSDPEFQAFITDIGFPPDPFARP
jgi:hypothetical protein